MRVCQACGSKQGPFAVYRIGGRTMARNIITCQPNLASRDVAEQRKPIAACLARRAKQDEKE